MEVGGRVFGRGGGGTHLRPKPPGREAPDNFQQEIAECGPKQQVFARPKNYFEKNKGNKSIKMGKNSPNFNKFRCGVLVFWWLWGRSAPNFQI